MRFWALALYLALVTPLFAAGPTSRPVLVQQVQAADAISGLLTDRLAGAIRESNSLQAYLQQTGQLDRFVRPPSTRPSQRLPYDQAYRAAMVFIREGRARSADPAISDLTDPQLEHELTVMHVHNQQIYLTLNAAHDRAVMLREYVRSLGRERDYRQWASGKDAAGEADLASAQDVVSALQTATTRPTYARSPNRPRNSLLWMEQHLPPEPTPEEATMMQVQADAERSAGIEEPEISRSSPREAAAAIAAGGRLPGSFGVPNTLAPLNARRPGTDELNPPSPRTMALPANAWNTQPMAAYTPGNPESVVPSQEIIQELANQLGISIDQAQAIALGYSDGGASGHSNGAFQSTPATSRDPRWSPFYFGPGQERNGWTSNFSDSLTFQPGGGTYSASDRRVNQVFDPRVNGNPDRRVNTNNDRRANIQVDPRVNY